MITRLIKATGFSGIGRLFSTLGNMLFVLVVSRHMDAGALGVYGLLFFFTQLFSGISPLGHQMYLAREVAHCREDGRELGRHLGDGAAALLWGGGLSILVWVVLGLCYDKLPFALLTLATAAGVLWGVEYLLSGVQIGLERLENNALWHGISLLLIVWALFGQSFFPLTLASLFWIRIAATTLGLLGRLYSLRGLKQCFTFTWRLHSFRESSFFWYSGWVYLASRQLDILILSFFLPDEVLGGYFLAFRIFLTFGIVAEVLGVALTPFISRAYHGREERSLDWLFRMVLLGIVAGGLPLALAFYYSRSWLVAIFNPLLVDSVSPMLAALAWVVPFSLGNHLIGAFFSASKYQRERLYIHLTVILVSLAALIPLIHFYSVWGAVWVKMGMDVLLFVLLTVKFKSIQRKEESQVVLS